MTIEVDVRTEYGQQRIYPVSHRRQIEMLTKQKTLSLGQIFALRQLGIEVEVRDVRDSAAGALVEKIEGHPLFESSN